MLLSALIHITGPLLLLHRQNTLNPSESPYNTRLASRAYEPQNYAYQEFDGTHRAMVFSHFTYGEQRRMVLKSQADSILVNDWGRVHVLLPLRRLPPIGAAQPPHRAACVPEVAIP